MNASWYDKNIKPTDKQCQDNDNRFIAWDGNRRYVTYFDNYDGIFRIPIDRGGIKRMEPDTLIIKWTEFPDPPEK